MRTLKHQLMIGLLTLIIACTVAVAWVISRPPVGNELEKDGVQKSQNSERLRPRPEARWEPIFFKIINEHTSEAGIPKLTTALLSDNDFEIRVWVGFGINGEDGIILRHSSNQWSAIHLHGMFERPPFVRTVSNLEVPQSGWEAAWQRLTQAGILTLPDALVADCSTHMFDGTSYVVEVNKDDTYRTYMYDNPNHSSCSEAKQMLKIAEILAEEFNLTEFRIRD